MKRLAVVIVVALLAGAGCWFFGLGILSAIVVVLVVGSAGMMLRTLTPPATSTEWPIAPPLPNDGARRETSELSWALRTRGGIVDDAVILRVRAIAASRLAHRQLDLDNPAHRRAIEALVGARVYELVNVRDGRRRVRLPSILGALEVLERLDGVDPPRAH
jgi:hypothetical protein